MASTARICKATTKDGKPCQAPCVNGSEFCFWHDPGHAEERAAARRRGGHARHGRTLSLGERVDDGDRQFRTLDDMVALLEVAIRATLTLENSISRNRCLGYLARCWSDVYETGELEQRLRILEEAMV